ncbi:F0F1 ATP synthase subunit epsilon [Jannaschia sp. CCS1]|uniref:ATP synthase epsilon chain n=1 Tax=Jannaschia sp. (strain CCS1) TaxID=290400 RepID=ATPE_JANSC|nr:F0F1 ATP synthase subunit epsilon [Jannaschia sp. CCS1]Q28TJ5.1 RecName: Full=ATP synthase epsilon chain; AltName: Full=ATP synthase F1 sector epsilon subunit; AltName: Full=F-ATPase epsilon subunit [Jannaschia sp. CCS1]ABD53967.1 ATP synthase F1 subcomplex epsilon subunit [Jannaschia sp. CCS1]
MATMQFDLVSPERRLASMEVTEVQIPGADGDLTAMPDHSPMITTLRPGVLKVSGAEGEKSYFVTGGFADIAGPSATILAERAMPVEEVTGEIVEELIKASEEQKSAASDGAADAAAKYHADLTMTLDAIVGR